MTGTPMQLIRVLSESPADKKWTLEEHSEKRSLNANAYYWKITSLLAEKLGLTTSRLHNTFLRDCGYVDRLNGDIVTVFLPDDDETENIVMESTTYHLYPTSHVTEGKKGNLRCYAVLRGSHTFNRKEMSRLIDLLVTEAKQQGIETLPPAELERMLDRWGNRKQTQ